MSDNNLTATQEADMVKSTIDRLKPLIRVTKIVSTRSVKGPRGDSYVGFSAAWNTTQDDAGGGGDLVSSQDETTGLSLKDARFAALMLGMQVDIAAHSQALAGGNMTQIQFDEAAKAIRNNYTKLMADLIRPLGNK